MNNKRSIILVPVVLALVVLAFVGLTKRRPKPKPIITQTTAQKELGGTPVEVANIAVKTVNDAVSVTGQLAAESVTNLSTKVPGKVMSVAAQEGATVRQGQVVIQLDDADARRQLDQALAGVQQAQAGLQSAAARLTSARTAARVGDVQSAAAVQQARAGLASARARLQLVTTGARKQERQQAENAVAIAKANLDKAQSDFNRYNNLFEQGAISAATLDTFKTQRDIAQANYNNAMQSRSIVQEGARSEDVRQAEAAVSAAQQQLRSAVAAQETNVNRQEDVRAAQAGVAQARAALAAAQAGVGIARQNVANFQIRAPRSGSVTSRNVEPGQYAQPGVPLLTIVDLGTVYLQADVSETDVERIHQGMTVNVKVDAFPGKVWTGKVESVIASADPASRTFTARIKVANPDRRLRPNMFARAEIVANRVTNALLVPKEAIINRNGRNSVMRIVKNDKGLIANEVPVSTGITSGDDVVVRSPALSKTDRVIIAGQQNLQNGDPVTTA